MPLAQCSELTPTLRRKHEAGLQGCVQVDLEKPLIIIIKCGDLEHHVQCEGINSMCFSCRRVGHKAEGYPYKTKSPEKVGEQVDGKGGEKVEVGNLPEHAKAATEEEAFRPWVLVTRKRQLGKNNKTVKA